MIWDVLVSDQLAAQAWMQVSGQEHVDSEL